MTTPVVLDCTLRDGGFYTRWDFDRAMVHAYLRAMAAARVDIVELGYRSVAGRGYAGAFRFTADDYVRRLAVPDTLSLAVMIDAKEFVSDGRVDRELLRQQFAPASASPITWVRVAAHAGEAPRALEQCDLLRDLGYRTTLNLMQVTTLAVDDIARLAAESCRRADAFYIADSVGALRPAQMQMLARALAAGGVTWGVHCHDNLQLGLANTLVAVTAGARFVDATVLGMGRGAGNVRTEALLHCLVEDEGGDYDPQPLVPLIAEHVEPLQRQHRWGTNMAYQLAAVHGIHPTYVQELLSTQRYSTTEVANALAWLGASQQGASFAPAALDAAINRRLESVDWVPVTRRFDAAGARARLAGRPALIVGRGASVAAKAADIADLIAACRPVTLECNVQPEVPAGDDHFCLFARYDTLRTQQDLLAGAGKLPVVAFTRVEGDVAAALDAASGVHLPYHVERGALWCADGECRVPHDVVAMYAFALALGLGLNPIYLVGFDGYEGSADPLAARRQAEMDECFGILARQYPHVHVEALTPTSYAVPQGSLYYRLAHGLDRRLAHVTCSR
jgi:4-hydroxy 2-oxovalerate aldolase